MGGNPRAGSSPASATGKPRITSSSLTFFTRPAPMFLFWCHGRLMIKFMLSKSTTRYRGFCWCRLFQTSRSGTLVYLPSLLHGRLQNELRRSLQFYAAILVITRCEIPLLTICQIRIDICEREVANWEHGSKQELAGSITRYRLHSTELSSTTSTETVSTCLPPPTKTPCSGHTSP